MDATDISRKEVLGKKNGNRRVAVRFYYPGVDSKGKVPCSFLTPGKSKEFGKNPDFSLYRKRIAIYDDLEIREGTFPLLLFSHDKPVHFLLFRDMAHNGFTDWKLVVKKPSDMGTADPELVMDTLNQANIAFFDRYLKAQDIDNAEKLPIDEAALEQYEIW